MKGPLGGNDKGCLAFPGAVNRCHNWLVLYKKEQQMFPCLAHCLTQEQHFVLTSVPSNYTLLEEDAQKSSYMAG